MRKSILLSLLVFTCIGWASAQSKLSDKRVEKFRVSAAELPALLEDLDLDPSLAETVNTSGDVEVMRITENSPSRPHAFFFDMDDRHDFNGIFDDLEIEMDDFDFDILKLEKSTERLNEDMERLAEELERNGQRLEKRIKMRINRDGDEEVIEWNGDGDMPAELQEKLDALDEELQDLDFNIAVEVEEDVDPWIARGVDPKPLLGVYHETHGEGGVLVTGIVDNSGAEDAGLQEGDRILALGGEKVEDADQLRDFIKSQEVGDDVLVSFLRDGKKQSVTATLGKNESDFRRKAHKWNQGHFPHMNMKKSMLGVELDIDEDQALDVEEVYENSNAQRIGVKEGDILVKMNGVDLSGMTSLSEQKKTLEDGDKFSITVDRNGSEVRLSGIWQESNKQMFKKNRTFLFEPAPKNKEIIIIRPVKDIPLEDRQIGFTDISVFPNPSSGNITVNFKGSDEPASIRISDANGRVIFERDTTPSNGRINENITLDSPVSGTLFVSVIQGSEVYTQRLVNN